ncbi:MAG TPA: hypothetical protein VHE83_16040 [Mycobacteriales bacterium]|nr:hypothetical protein [Mycobacteriales bacterium]
MTGRIALDRRARRPAGVLGAAIVLTLGGGVWTAIVRVDHGSGPDAVTAARGATLTTDAGSRLAVKGDHLRVGDALVTDATGQARLDVPGGELVLGPSTAVRVVGPRLTELLRGTAGLRLHHGAALSLQTGTVTASVSAAGAGVRVARDYRVTAAALAGGASLSGVDGGHLDLPALTEADVPGIELPSSAIPVQELDHDPSGVDAVLAPDLVRSDVALDRLAAQVDADTVAHTALHPASFEATTLPSSVAHPSEIALTRAMGQATGGDVAARRAVELRAAGAAWGVVAAELDVTVEELRPLIDEMLATPTLRALVPAVATQTVVADAPASEAPVAPAHPVTHPATQPVPRSTGSPHPAAPAPTTAPPTSSPTSDPIAQLVAEVTSLLGGSPSPSPSPAPSPSGGGLLCPIVSLVGLC